MYNLVLSVSLPEYTQHSSMIEFQLILLLTPVEQITFV